MRSPLLLTAFVSALAVAAAHGAPTPSKAPPLKATPPATIKDADWPTSQNGGQAKQAALADIKAAQTAVNAIMEAEHIQIKTASGTDAGDSAGKSRTDPLTGKAADQTLSSVHKTLEKASGELRKGDSDDAVKSNLKTASDQVSLASNLVEVAANAAGSKTHDGASSSSSSK